VVISFLVVKQLSRGYMLLWCGYLVHLRVYMVFHGYTVLFRGYIIFTRGYIVSHGYITLAWLVLLVSARTIISKFAAYHTRWESYQMTSFSNCSYFSL